MNIMSTILRYFITVVFVFASCESTSHVETFTVYRRVSVNHCYQKSETQCEGWWLDHRCKTVYFCDYRTIWETRAHTDRRCKSGWHPFPQCNIATCSPNCQAGHACIRPDFCLDIDECTEEIDGCQHLCANTIGGYNCSCREGFKLNKDGRSCYDIDECLEGKHGCDHYCVNSEGSFQCRCVYGYELLRDNKTCAEID